MDTQNDPSAPTVPAPTLTRDEREKLTVYWHWMSAAVLVAPQPIDQWVHVVASSLLAVRWWGVLRGLAAFLLPWPKSRGRAESGVREAVPFHGAVTLNAPPLVRALVLATDSDPVVEVSLRRLCDAATAITTGGWVELRGLGASPLVVQREALARVLTAATLATTQDAVRVLVVEVDLAVAGSPARTVVFDGGVWVALLTEGYGAPDLLKTKSGDRAVLDLRGAQGGAS